MGALRSRRGRLGLLVTLCFLAAFAQAQTKPTKTPMTPDQLADRELPGCTSSAWGSSTCKDVADVPALHMCRRGAHSFKSGSISGGVRHQQAQKLEACG